MNPTGPPPIFGRSRRELLRAGALTLGGITLSDLLRNAPAQAAGAGKSFGRAKSCILLYLSGGPPQHETWDPKPEAPAEIRGPYGWIPTPVDGLLAGELMPKLAKLADRCSVIRSVSTDINVHTGSGYWMLTGHPHRLRDGDSMPPDPQDWPCVGSVAKKFLAAPKGLPASISLPEQVKNNPGVVVAGQHAGFLGVNNDPFFIAGDPSAGDFQVSGLTALPDVPLGRIQRRQSLLDGVNQHLDRAVASVSIDRANTAFSEAFDLLTSQKTRSAFDLKRESVSTRERYGPHKFGQSVLLARRLVESGVRLVTVNWPREPGDLMKGNPVWDTHSDNAGRLKDALMPPMDQACSALLLDLEERGLLDETLVVWMGEFGRTPKFNAYGGRDHWGHVFSVMLAGGGVKRGAVYGESDRQGAYPQTDRVSPEDFHATLYHCLGIPAEAEIRDPLDRPLRLCEGEPIRAILGSS